MLALLTVVMTAHWLGTIDPQAIATTNRLRPPSLNHWFGTDRLGRDVYSRVLFGTGASLAVGLCVMIISAGVGLLLGLLAGATRTLDALIMRTLDGVMAVPGVLLALAVVSVAGASVSAVVASLAIYETPRFSRLVRSVVISMRHEPYVEAASVLGSSRRAIMLFHMVPAVLAPGIVVATHVAASAMLLEATLSFLGCGLPPDVPTWGNIMADGRILFRIAPWIVLFPGLVLSSLILALNLIGDGLREIFMLPTGNDLP